MHLLPVLAVSALFVLLNGGLWYVRPNPHVWLFGSISLGALWFFAFLRTITRNG